MRRLPGAASRVARWVGPPVAGPGEVTQRPSSRLPWGEPGAAGNFARMSANAYDAIVIGGGHNGLVAAAYLARAGKRTVVLERRHVVGGAAVTEQPWGPDYKVTMLSYVVSLLPPTILRDLQLERHGYRVLPAGPVLRAVPRRPLLQLPADPARRRAEIAKFSDARRRRHRPLGRLARTAWPTSSGRCSRRSRPSSAAAPRATSRDQARLAWQLRGPRRAAASPTSPGSSR